MRHVLRFKAIAVITLLITATVLLLVQLDRCEQLDTVSFIKASLPWRSKDPAEAVPPDDGYEEDKIIVVAARIRDDISWIERELPECVAFEAVTKMWR